MARDNPIPLVLQPEDEEAYSPAHHEGYDRFWRSFPLNAMTDGGQTAGWMIGWTRAYAQGAKASILDGDAETLCPYDVFSGPWEAWCQGYTEEEALPAPAAPEPVPAAHEYGLAVKLIGVATVPADDPQAALERFWDALQSRPLLDLDGLSLSVGHQPDTTIMLIGCDGVSVAQADDTTLN